MKRTNPPREPTPEELQHWDARAPGWQIRCLKCGFTEPFGKYGIRLAAAGKQCTIGLCRNCRWLRFQVIERRSDASGAGPDRGMLGSFRTIGVIGLAVTVALNVLALWVWHRTSAHYFSTPWWAAWFPSYGVWLVFTIIGCAGCRKPKPANPKPHP
jgi:hypothetical protein